jgi:hypothetical protein
MGLAKAEGGGKERKSFALSRSPTREMIFLDLLLIEISII